MYGVMEGVGGRKCSVIMHDSQTINNVTVHSEVYSQKVFSTFS